MTRSRLTGKLAAPAAFSDSQLTVTRRLTVQFDGEREAATVAQQIGHKAKPYDSAARAEERDLSPPPSGTYRPGTSLLIEVPSATHPLAICCICGELTTNPLSVRNDKVYYLQQYVP